MLKCKYCKIYAHKSPVVSYFFWGFAGRPCSCHCFLFIFFLFLSFQFILVLLDIEVSCSVSKSALFCFLLVVLGQFKGIPTGKGEQEIFSVFFVSRHAAKTHVCIICKAIENLIKLYGHQALVILVKNDQTFSCCDQNVVT